MHEHQRTPIQRQVCVHNVLDDEFAHSRKSEARKEEEKKSCWYTQQFPKHNRSIRSTHTQNGRTNMSGTLPQMNDEKIPSLIFFLARFHLCSILRVQARCR